MTGLEVVVAIAILVGFVGVVVPALPGTLLVGGAILVWAIATGGVTAWVVFGVATLWLVLGTVVKYALPGRQMKASGIPTRTMLAGTAVAVVGFFTVPVVGVPLGFVLGIYLSELRRLGTHAAWPSTRSALKAVGLSMLIELTACGLAAATWGTGLATT